MKVTEQIKQHRSIRRFTSANVEEKVLREILECAVRAPTGGSMQLYSMLVTTSSERREELAALHLGSEVVRTAPLVITFCVDCHRITRWLELSGEDASFDNGWGFGMGFSDALLAAQNALLAAEAEGLGGCFLGSTFVSAPALARFFGCPSQVVPVATLALGYPDEVPDLATRLPVDAVTHRERYSEVAASDLLEFYEAHARVTFDRFCTVPYVSHAVRAAGIEDLAGYFARLMYPSELISTAGAYFQAAVDGQGFGDEPRAARIRAVQRACQDSQIASLHPVRQLAFAMALVSGHADHVVHMGPARCEAEIARFMSSRDSKILEELVERGIFDMDVRKRVLMLLKDFEATHTAHAAE